MYAHVGFFSCTHWSAKQLWFDVGFCIVFSRKLLLLYALVLDMIKKVNYWFEITASCHVSCICDLMGG